jgi:uncharacterized protein
MMTAARPVVDQRGVERFLEGHRFALVGASDAAGSFSTTVMTALQAHGYDVVPVNRRQPVIDGGVTCASVGDIEGTVDGAIVMVPSDAAEGVVRECVDAGITKVWLFRGVGKGACSDGAVKACRDHGVDLINGACPLMFLEPVRGVHRLHRGIRRVRKSLVVGSGGRATPEPR